MKTPFASSILTVCYALFAATAVYLSPITPFVLVVR